ncbi:MAG: NAD(P)-dependent oxidoreductase [Verrucomicrobiales bacterium]|nr:NAD(P)-dependent oxidoreductase [Verrucomicrobiales bacterium]
MNKMSLPFKTQPESLDEFMSRPSQAVLQSLKASEGDILVLGAGGKMGLHVCLMLQRAFEELGEDKREVIAVSRFGGEGATDIFAREGVRTIAANLCDQQQLDALPDAPSVIFLAGVKFGTSHDPGLLRQMNVEMPALVASRFRKSRIVALSTGCVYSFTTRESGGSSEATGEVNPVGEYAQSCLGREQAFVTAGEQWGTKCSLIRLNYAIDLRYGVLHDIAQKVIHGQPIDVTMGYVNLIWQTDAIAHCIQALNHAAAPAFVVNVTGRKILSVRDLALRFGKLLGKEVCIEGEEAELAWLSDSSKAGELFGSPEVSIEQMLEWTVAWLMTGGGSLGKPTHFETRDGKY